MPSQQPVIVAPIDNCGHAVVHVVVHLNTTCKCDKVRPPVESQAKATSYPTTQMTFLENDSTFFPNPFMTGTPIKFEPTYGSDTLTKDGISTEVSARTQNIACMKEYKHKSFEELRLEDYMAQRKCSQAATTPSSNANVGLRCPSEIINRFPQNCSGGLQGFIPQPITSGFQWPPNNNSSFPSTNNGGFRWHSAPSRILGTSTAPFATTFGSAAPTPGGISSRTSGFGSSRSPRTSGFGSSTSSRNAGFGSSVPSSTSVFGCSAPSSWPNSVCYSSAPPPGRIFGSSTSSSTLGCDSSVSPSTSVFGSSAPSNSSVFGSSPSSRTLPFGSSAPSSREDDGTFFPNPFMTGTPVKFEPTYGSDTLVKDGLSREVSTRTQNIACMKEYKNKSFEELRLEDYRSQRKCSQAATTPSSNANGRIRWPSQIIDSFPQNGRGGLQGSIPQPFAGGFQWPPNNNSSFPSTNNGGSRWHSAPSTILGTSTAPIATTFGSAAPTPRSISSRTSGFGGSRSPRTSGFGSSTSALNAGFGSSVQSSTSGFAPTPGSIFGSSAPSGTSLFGSSAPSSSQVFVNSKPSSSQVFVNAKPSSTRIFGNSAQSSTSVFGSTAPTPGSIFGVSTPSSTSIFSYSAPSSSQFFANAVPLSRTCFSCKFALFPSSVFDSTAPTPGSIFGSSAPPSSQLLGNSVPSSTCIVCNSAPTSSSIFGSAALTPGSIFGSSASSNTSGFGSFSPSNTSAFGSSAPSSSQLFGNSVPSSTRIFGNSAPSSTSVFGSAALTPGSLFGNSAPSSTSVFGSAALTPGSIFGSSASSNTSGFGSSSLSNTSAFGSSAPSSSQLFGNSVPSSNLVFGSSLTSGAAVPLGFVPPMATLFGSAAPATDTAFGSSASSRPTTFSRAVSTTTSFGCSAPASESLPDNKLPPVKTPPSKPSSVSGNLSLGTGPHVETASDSAALSSEKTDSSVDTEKSVGAAPSKKPSSVPQEELAEVAKVDLKAEGGAESDGVIAQSESKETGKSQPNEASAVAQRQSLEKAAVVIQQQWRAFRARLIAMRETVAFQSALENLTDRDMVVDIEDSFVNVKLDDDDLW